MKTDELLQKIVYVLEGAINSEVKEYNKDGVSARRMNLQETLVYIINGIFEIKNELKEEESNEQQYL